ncbi:amp-dependent synthetase and ligase [Moniliophthora roreri MCA 2997]|uniref:Amp-dependent synthetase and ligase n=1 Tax=Moniliophthora roreri (strain MCA 2997) TaxID=1381753 RepID=V2XHW5_MONRO|nr:amp-dependent synthetase and ligase [Moniliophthora roreri MCA 2997]
MTIPLSFLRTQDALPGLSLCDTLANQIAHSSITTLLDCLCATSSPAIHSPDISRPPLNHDILRTFVSQFHLPCPVSHSPLGPNDRVAVVLPTGPENAVALLAVAAYHTCAPLNASCTAAELKEDAARLNVKAVLATRDSAQRLELAALHRELGCDVVFIEARSSGPAGLFTMTLLGQVIPQPSHTPTRPHTLDDLSLVLHTSGTSGKKKVVPYTLRSLIVGTWAVVHPWDLQMTDVNMNMMPLFHVGGIVRNLLAPVLSGGSTIVCAGFDPIAFWTVASDLGATWYYAAPTIHHAILSSQPDHIDVVRDMKIRMICNAAGGLLPSLALDIKKRFAKAVILPSYGMTECMPIASPPTTYQLDRPGCSGIACGPYLSIRDPSNLERQLPPGQTGAVSVRGLPMFSGYEVSPDRSVPLDTSAFSSEGWFDSGDMGYMDEDGYLFITGRSKEIINKGGEVVSPFEVEEAITTAAGQFVKTTLAFSVEHDVLQETIGVVIVPAPDRPRIGLSQLHDLLRDHLHPSKWPFLIVYMQDVPKNNAGKPLRIKLSQRLGLGCLSDDVRALDRHYEAEVPHTQASLSESIACKRVDVNLTAVEDAISQLAGIADAAARIRGDGILEAFVSVHDEMSVDSDSLCSQLARSLPGYAVPEIRVLDGPLSRGSQGEPDFDFMEKDMVRLRSSEMSPQACAVRDIVAELLNINSGNITAQSDFFLLGGNSLLLGRLSYQIRKRLGVNIPVPTIFTNSTIAGIASFIEAEAGQSRSSLSNASKFSGYSSSSATLNDAQDANSRKRGQNHPFVVMIQSVPLLFFHQLKAALTWSLLLYLLSCFSPLLDGTFFQRMGSLLCSMIVARFAVRIIAPLTAIAFKWVVIGKYQPGTYPTWSNYYLRWWLVNQSLLMAGRGVFAIHPELELWYYRLLGAKIGRNVRIDSHARLGEFDLITIGDGCRIDNALVRGFCVEREGYFRLAPIVIEGNVVVNTYTQISPGSTISKGAVYGPHSSSLEPPSPPECAASNKQSISEAHWALQVFVGLPIIAAVTFISYIPWFYALWLMFDNTFVLKDGLSPVLAVVYWFASPQRIAFHFLSRVVRAVIVPVLQLVLGIMVKRALGLNVPGPNTSQVVLLRRFINSNLLSQRKLKAAFEILGSHYEPVSVVYRLMGAKIGRRVYWPGSGIYCQDPELLEIGDDVVFGSRSEILTTDALGSMKISIGNGAMIADRVVLLPGTVVGSRAVLGSGALGAREKVYEAGSTWIGSSNGQAICLNEGSSSTEKASDTTTPFGRAFYQGKAPYFVFPYPMILIINIVFTAFCAIYWSAAAITTVQILRILHIHAPHLDLFTSHWYELGILFGLVASCYLVLMTIQVVLSVAWVVAAKWAVIGRRKPGRYDWDTSDYCQRWQLHLVLSKLMFSGFGSRGVLGPMTGTVFAVWFYRALGAKMGRDCVIFPGGQAGLMTEPDLVQLGDSVSLDNCSVVAHINSRGNFSLNKLTIGNGCAMRTGSRLLSGASMEDHSMLCEHTLLTSGEVADAGGVYIGWPASRAS